MGDIIETALASTPLPKIMVEKLLSQFTFQNKKQTIDFYPIQIVQNNSYAVLVFQSTPAFLLNLVKAKAAVKEKGAHTKDGSEEGSESKMVNSFGVIEQEKYSYKAVDLEKDSSKEIKEESAGNNVIEMQDNVSNDQENEIDEPAPNDTVKTPHASTDQQGDERNKSEEDKDEKPEENEDRKLEENEVGKLERNEGEKSKDNEGERSEENDGELAKVNEGRMSKVDEGENSEKNEGVNSEENEGITVENIDARKQNVDGRYRKYRSEGDYHDLDEDFEVPPRGNIITKTGPLNKAEREYVNTGNTFNARRARLRRLRQLPSEDVVDYDLMEIVQQMKHKTQSVMDRKQK